MIPARLFDKLHVRSVLLRIVFGSALVALLVALGIVAAFYGMGMDVDPVLPAVFAVIAAALYAANVKRT
jgi:H+/gluconate symporter-like permease